MQAQHIRRMQAKRVRGVAGKKGARESHDRLIGIGVKECKPSTLVEGPTFLHPLGPLEEARAGAAVVWGHVPPHLD